MRRIIYELRSSLFSKLRVDIGWVEYKNIGTQQIHKVESQNFLDPVLV